MKDRILKYRNRFSETTWTVSLRRQAGRVKKVNIYNPLGQALGCDSLIIGDRLIVKLKNGPSSGEMKVVMTGDSHHYFFSENIWSRVKNIIKILFRIKGHIRRQLPPGGHSG